MRQNPSDLTLVRSPAARLFGFARCGWRANILLLGESEVMEGARNKKNDDTYVTDVETRTKVGFYNSDDFCRDVAEVILDLDAFWRKESQSKPHQK